VDPQAERERAHLAEFLELIEAAVFLTVIRRTARPDLQPRAK
jgi:hypothetical protein